MGVYLSVTIYLPCKLFKGEKNPIYSILCSFSSLQFASLIYSLSLLWCSMLFLFFLKIHCSKIGIPFPWFHSQRIWILLPPTVTSLNTPCMLQWSKIDGSWLYWISRYCCIAVPFFCVLVPSAWHLELSIGDKVLNHNHTPNSDLLCDLQSWQKNVKTVLSINNSSIQTGIQVVMGLLKNTPYTIAPKKKKKEKCYIWLK